MRTHTHTKTHTYTFIAGSSSVVYTNKHINSFVFPLCFSVSRRLTPVWFYLYCFSLGPKLYLFYSKACTHLGPESAYSSIHWFTAMHMVLPQRDSGILLDNKTFQKLLHCCNDRTEVLVALKSAHMIQEHSLC